MAKLAVHPHIGFLNTEFSIHIICEPEETFTNGNLVINRIETVDNSAESVISIERGNRTVSHKFDKAGIYSIRIEGQSESIQVEVKDAIRFGGGQHKANYIFDETPWCFIVMEDRTYFYNRDTKEQYVESISPDVIQVVNKEVVLFKSSKKEKENSLYSLANHRIFANYTTGEIVDNRWLVSEVETKGIKNIDIISFDIDEICHLQFEYQDYQIDAQRKSVYIIDGNVVSALSLETMEILDSRTYNNERPLCFTNIHYYILQNGSGIFAVCDILDFRYVTNIQAENPVSSFCTKLLLCKDKIGELDEFCLYVQMQVESLLRYYYSWRFKGDDNKLYCHILGKPKDPDKDIDITYNNLLWDFKKEFGEKYNITIDVLDTIRILRNGLVHSGSNETASLSSKFIEEVLKYAKEESITLHYFLGQQVSINANAFIDFNTIINKDFNKFSEYRNLTVAKNPVQKFNKSVKLKILKEHKPFDAIIIDLKKWVAAIQSELSNVK